MDLERRFKMIQDEKYRIEQSIKQRSTMSVRQTDDSLLEMRRTEGAIVGRQQDLKDMETQIYSCKGLLDDKDAEILRLRRDQAAYEDNNAKLLREKQLLEEDIRSIKYGHMSAKKEAESIAIENERINSERAVVGGRAREAEDELIMIRRRIEDEEVRFNLARRNKEQKDTELNVVINAKSSDRQEVERINLANMRLENENREIAQRIAEIESQLLRTRQRCNDGSLLIDNKNKEIMQLRSSLSLSESRDLSANVDLRKSREEREILERMLDKYREDVDFQKRLRELESSKKYELQQEKKKLESEALSKDLEARSAKRELERIKDTHGSLIEDRMQMDEELNALRQHAEVLENQNSSLSNELDSIAYTGEKVRQELDRKPRVDYLKSKNNEELQRSIEKVRISTSPRRSPYKTDYSSPYRSPNKY